MYVGSMSLDRQARFFHNFSIKYAQAIPFTTGYLCMAFIVFGLCLDCGDWNRSLRLGVFPSPVTSVPQPPTALPALCEFPDVAIHRCS
jgi:hypothetical protein